MNPNLRLTAALGMTLLLGSSAYSQMGGGAPAPVPPGVESPGPDTSGIRETPPGFEVPPAEGADAEGAEKKSKWNITESMEEWEKIEGGGPEGVWNQARDIFRPGKGAIPAPAIAPSQTQAQTPDAADLTGESVRLPVLHGVMTGSDDDRVAILGQNMVREGDFCDGFTVRSIKPRRVTLSRDGKEYVLYVKE